eukprot:3518489-Rhodomonas_salina.1
MALAVQMNSTCPGPPYNASVPDLASAGSTVQTQQLQPYKHTSTKQYCVTSGCTSSKADEGSPWYKHTPYQPTALAVLLA